MSRTVLIGTGFFFLPRLCDNEEYNGYKNSLMSLAGMLQRKVQGILPTVASAASVKMSTKLKVQI